MYKEQKCCSHSGNREIFLHLKDSDSFNHVRFLYVHLHSNASLCENDESAYEFHKALMEMVQFLRFELISRKSVLYKGKY